MSKKTVSTFVGRAEKVTLKNAKSKVNWQVISGKKVVSIKKSGKYKNTVAIKAKKTGTAKVRAVCKEKKYTIKVRVSKRKPTDKPGTSNMQGVVLNGYFDKIYKARSSTLGKGTEVSANLFDGNPATKFYTSEHDGIIAWQMKRLVILKTYALTTANDSALYSYRNPAQWRLYGSNNGSAWTQIDMVEDSGIEAKNGKSYTYDTDVQESFQYYILQIETNKGTLDTPGYWVGGLQFAEISMYGDVSKMSGDIGDSLNTHFDEIIVDKTTISGFQGETPANLFDGETATKLCSGSAVPGSIVWKMTQPTTLYSYTLTTANDNKEWKGRNPKAWSLYGSQDGENWDKIDRVNNGEMADENYKSYTYTVDKVAAYQYYKLEITAKNGNIIQFSEIGLKGAAESPNEYNMLFAGDWDQVKEKGYKDALAKLFYNSYPRLYKRWGITGAEPKTIILIAESPGDGVAYAQGSTVHISTNYVNANPNDIGYFSHEITHSIQQYGGLMKYGKSDNDAHAAWWTENMANYGGFRYFHWSNLEYVQIYEASDKSLQDWGYESYGNNKWFFAYMDAKYPSRKDADGNITYGLIDSINNLIKSNKTGKAYDDDPYDTLTPFNQTVKEVTGYDCIDDLRLKFVEELQNGTWEFTGFADYEDNWITEDIPGLANPVYPMVGEKMHGDKTAPQIDTVTDGTNLCQGASILSCSGFINNEECAAKLIDGDLGTKWCATKYNSVNGMQYQLSGVKHWIKIDLGEQKTFNTYTIYNTKSRELGYGNTTEWEILVSNDGENWTSVDYQASNNNEVASFNIGSQTARYLFMKVFTPDNGPGTVRLYEFQLYSK